MSLISKLEEELYQRIRQTGKYCDLIVMHPQTWVDLKKEVFDLDSTVINRHDPSLKYKGIRVIRSLDIEENLFLVR